MELNKPVEYELGPGQTHEYTIGVKAGQFFHVIAEQKGVDVVLRLLDPVGKELFSMDSSPAFGFEHASALSKAGGAYLLKVEAKPGSLLNGKYSLILRARARPKKNDRERLHGEELLRAAMADQRVATKASRLQAIDEYKQANAIWQRIRDSYQQGLGLIKLGRIYVDLGETARGMECFQGALVVLRTNSDRTVRAGALLSIGMAHWVADENQEALKYYQEALEVFRAVGDRSTEMRALHNIGLVYSDLGEKEKARDYLEQALAIERAIGERSVEALTLRSLGNVYSDIGQNPKAMESYQAALQLHREAGDRNNEAGTLTNIGILHQSLGEMRQALEYYRQALPVHREMGERKNEASTLNSLGTAHSALDEKQLAIEYFEQASRLYRELGVASGEAVALSGLGIVYYDLGDHAKALEYDEKALAIQRTLGRRANVAALLNDIGNIYFDRGDSQKALTYQLESLELKRAALDRQGEAIVLTNLGQIYSVLGDHQKALTTYRDALRIEREIGLRRVEAHTLNYIANNCVDLGDLPSAISYFQQALPIHRAVSDRTGEAGTLTDLMFAIRSSQPDLAIFFGKQAVNVLQSIRRDNRGLEEGLRQSYAKKVESNYRALADLLIERNRFGEAEEVLNLLKNKEAADFLRSDSVTAELRSATLLDFEKQALDRYEQILDQVVTLGQRKSALLAKSDKSPLTAAELSESTRLDGDLDAANTVLRKFFDEQEKAFAADSGLAKRVQEFKEAEGLQDTLQKLGTDVVAIYTLVTPEKYVAMLVTSGSRKAYTTKIAETDLNKKIFEFREKLQDAGWDPMPLARELYPIVFPEGLRQDLDALKVKTIMWSIDAPCATSPLRHYTMVRTTWSSPFATR